MLQMEQGFSSEYYRGDLCEDFDYFSISTAHISILRGEKCSRVKYTSGNYQNCTFIERLHDTHDLPTAIVSNSATRLFRVFLEA